VGAFGKWCVVLDDDAAPDTGEEAAIDKPALRLLEVAEAVARRGPSTLADLVADLGLPRGAVWRALNMLRRKGWVRMRAGDSAFELCSPVVDLFANAPHQSDEVSEALPLFDMLVAWGPLHVDLGGFVGRGAFRVIESTRRDGYSAGMLSLTDDDLALAALIGCPPDVVSRHLASFQDRATGDERQVIASGDHIRHLRRLRAAGAVWQEDGTTVSFPIAGLPGFALRAELWRVSRARIVALRAAVQRWRRWRVTGKRIAGSADEQTEG